MVEMLATDGLTVCICDEQVLVQLLVTRRDSKKSKGL